MDQWNDAELLSAYVNGQSEAAFEALVERYVALVYSAALRQVHNPQLAQEVTQAVFFLLAQKARRLSERTVLSGWLCHAAYYVARNAVKAELRRQFREKEAYMQSLVDQPEMEAWQQFAPVLDEAVAQLNEADRNAVVLRFYEQKPLNEMGGILGIDPDTAQKRVSRALEKLRKFLARRGVVSTTAMIAGAISGNSVQAAPAGLSKIISVAALAKGAAASGTTLTLAHGVLKLMAWTKAQTAVVVGVGVILVAASGTVIVKNAFFPTEPSYQGRSLLYWLADVAPNDSPPDYGRPSAKQTRAIKAIRMMGTRTIPFLLADLGDKRFSHIHYAEPDKRTADERNGQAIWAFDALDSLGKPAIPELVKLLHENCGYAPEALAGIGPDAMPELMGALTNGEFWVRDNTAAALANALYRQKITPVEAQAAFPVALNNLANTSTNLLDGISIRVNTRHRAAGLLGALHLNPDVSVPALIQGLNGKDPTVAMECADSLSEFGKDAVPAIPALIDGMHNSNSMIAGQCAFALGNAGLVDHATSAIPALIQGLSDTNGIMAFCCASTLGNFSPQALGANRADVISALNKMANSTNAQLSSIASQSVNNIQRRR